MYLYLEILSSGIYHYLVYLILILRMVYKAY